MEEKEIITIKNADGEMFEAELVTYLVSNDKLNTYIVYTKNEKQENDDQIIYVSKIISAENVIKIEEITDNAEWLAVQELLKEIANK